MVVFYCFLWIPSYSMSVPQHVPAQVTRLKGRAAVPAASLKDRDMKGMKTVPGMPYHTRTFDTAKTWVLSEQEATPTQESVLQSRAAEEQTKCYKMPSLVQVQTGWDVLSGPGVS